MRAGAEVQTSMVSPQAARDAMEPLLAAGDDILYLGLSGGVSGTCWGVGLVAEELREEHPGRDIRVVDTRGASLGEGLIVLEAAHMARQGAAMDDILSQVYELRSKMRQHFMVDDLKYLRKGGRLSGAAALVGTLLQIKPILQPCRALSPAAAVKIQSQHTGPHMGAGDGLMAHREDGPRAARLVQGRGEMQRLRRGGGVGDAHRGGLVLHQLLIKPDEGIHGLLAAPLLGEHHDLTLGIPLEDL